MSGLSLIMKGKVLESGSDISLNKNIERLKKKRWRFILATKTKSKNATIIVVSSAIKGNNPEIVERKKSSNY